MDYTVGSALTRKCLSQKPVVRTLGVALPPTTASCSV